MRKLTPKSELKSLYRQRWHVELEFRNLKTTMGMEMLSSKSPAMATNVPADPGIQSPVAGADGGRVGRKR